MSTPTPTRPDTARLDQLAVRLLDAVLDSADVDTVGVTHWWDRAQAALTTGAAAGVDWPSMVSATCRKMQVTYALRPSSAVTVAAVGAELAAEPALLPALRDHCRRNAVYVVALCRIGRQARQAETKAARAKKTPAPAAEEIKF
jgi:hypothetical protein